MSKAEKQMAVVKEDPKALEVAQPLDLYEDANSDTSDILIPKLLLMQGLSQAVADEKANAGDIVNSVSLEVLGGKNKPVEFVPVKEAPKTWVIEKFSAGKWEFARQEPWTPANKDAEWTFMENGIEMRRSNCLNFFVYLTRDSESFTAFPYVVAFRRTSYQAGKKLHTFFETLKMAARQGDRSAIPMGQVFVLESSIQKGEKGNYHVFDIAPKRKATAPEMNAGIRWFKNLKSVAVQVDESDLKTPSDPVDSEELARQPGETRSTDRF